MEKKKTKLTISGNKKKPIDNIELAKLQNKNSVVIEKKTSRFGGKTSFKRSFGFNKTNQNIGFKSNTFLTKKPQNSLFSAGAPRKINDYEKRKLAEERATRRLKSDVTSKEKESRGKVSSKKRELKLTVSRALNDEMETKTRSLASLIIMSKLLITWTKSSIGYADDQRRTIRALGLRRLHQKVEKPDTLTIRGMLNKVTHLVNVEELA